MCRAPCLWCGSWSGRVPPAIGRLRGGAILADPKNGHGYCFLFPMLYRKLAIDSGTVFLLTDAIMTLAMIVSTPDNFAAFSEKYM